MAGAGVRDRPLTGPSRLAGLAVAVLVLAGVTVVTDLGRPAEVGGEPVAAERILPAPDGTLVRDGTDPPPGPATDTVVGAVLTDLLTFFRQSFPTRSVAPLAGGVVAVDPRCQRVPAGWGAVSGRPGRRRRERHLLPVR